MFHGSEVLCPTWILDMKLPTVVIHSCCFASCYFLSRWSLLLLRVFAKNMKIAAVLSRASPWGVEIETDARRWLLIVTISRLPRGANFPPPF
jgi:hypothetical protein